MKEEDILEILLDWNYWKKELDSGIERNEYLNKIKEILKTNFIISIIGIRRSGKSYLLRQIVKSIHNKENTLIVNFEDKRFPEILDLNILDKIFEVYIKYIKPKDKPLILLDEIHKVKNWEKWVRTFHELNKGKIIVTGSTSQLIKEELSELLTGRHLDIVVFPLNFKEFLKFKNIKFSSLLDLIKNKQKIKELLIEYLEWGGFPEVVLTKNKEIKQQILATYFDDIITKDIIKRYKIIKIKELETLAKYYLTNISSKITYRRISKFLNISTDTVKTYTKYLENVFLIFMLNNFSRTIKEQEKSPRKVYSIDTGLSNIIGLRFSENIGRLMENIVAIHLLIYKTNNLNIELYYFKDYANHEVDFVIKEGLKIKQLIQVTYASEFNEIKEREWRNLILASKKLDCKNLLIITWDYENEAEFHWEGIKRKIKFIPLWKWLLNIK